MAAPTAPTEPTGDEPDSGTGIAEPGRSAGAQRQFFEFAGPLFTVVISPAASTTPVERVAPISRPAPRSLAPPRRPRISRSRGRSPKAAARFANTADQEVSSGRPGTPGLARLRVTVTQRDVTCTAEALITVTDRLDVAAAAPATVNTRGLPGYTFERAAGELWRSSLRCRAQPHRRQQRPSRLRVRDAQSRAAAALPRAALRQGARAEELRGRTGRAAARAHDRAVAVRRGETQSRCLAFPGVIGDSSDR